MSPTSPSLQRFWLLLVAFGTLPLPVTAIAQPSAQSVGGGRYHVEFVCEAPPGTRSVHLAGSFNGWSMSAAPMTGPDADGRFTLALDLGSGRYEYKFVLDGERWISDEGNPNRLLPHDNAVLHLGEGPAAPAVEAASTRVDMGSLAAHPLAIAAMGRAEVSDDRHYESQLTQAGLAGQMPWFADGTMSFVVRAPDASDVRLHISGQGFDHHYPMASLSQGGNVHAVTLRSDSRLFGATYEFEITTQDGVRAQLDSQALMHTSRAGRPVSVIAPADPARGRILYLGRIADITRSVAARDVYVYLPPGYHDEPERRYPVIYLHDGQNCWDDPFEPFGHGGWQVNVTADRLIAAGEVEPFIAVGVANTPDRIAEYGPGPDILAAGGHPYMDYLVRDVKPTIDARFRTRAGRESTFVMGSSLGGVISFQLALRRPEDRKSVV